MAEPTVALPSDTPARDDFQSDLMPPTVPGSAEDAPLDPSSDIIIRSKVRAPVLRDSTLARPRLLEWMDRHTDERVRVLAAEAGFGKTTLLADWARRTVRTVRWLKLDPVDAEWATFISYLVAAFQEGQPDFGSATLRLLGHIATLGVTCEQATGQLIAELNAAVVEPTVLIVDDIQHIQGNTDVRAVLERLIDRAPEHLSLVLSGRGKPDLRLGRQTAQGNVVSLGTDDLRFTREETDDLFRVGYRIPLDGDLVGIVESRTEGWGASLALIYSSLRGQRKAEVKGFIRALAGSHEPLYDFLAEEVLGRQTVQMQQILLHASILDRIVPAWVSAALSVLDDAPPIRRVEAALDDADELGLMSRNSARSASRRFHPLLREFLASHLSVTTSVETLRRMHLRVAEAAEPSHWPTSAHHFIEAGEGEQAMRVIGDATIIALGTGAVGAALRLLDRIPHLVPTPPVLVIQARGLTTSGDAPSALQLLRGLDSHALASGRDRALVRLATASALDSTPDHDRVPEVLNDVINDGEAPPFLALIARAWFDLCTALDARGAISSVSRLADEAGRQGLHLYVGLARHNLCLTLLAQRALDEALREGRLAVESLGMAESDEGQTASAMVAMAHAQFELEDHDGALLTANAAVRRPVLHPDALAEAALLLLWTGHSRDAGGLIKAGWDSLGTGSRSPLSTSVMHAAEACLQLARGNSAGAWLHACRAQTSQFDINQTGFVLVVRAFSAIANLSPAEAAVHIRESGLELTRLHCKRWFPYITLLSTIIDSDIDGLVDILEERMVLSASALLVAVDAVAPALNQLKTVPTSLGAHVRKWPQRWRPSLRRALTMATSVNGRTTATLLASVGLAEDVSIIRDWEQKRKRSVRDNTLSSQLAKRISPTLMIHDLGQTSMVLAERQVMLADVRRRAATLLLYLVSRPRHTATREQVFEALWPDQGPSQASNSLHQTLYFLRQELVSDKDDGRPLVEYVPVETDLIYLASDLVHVDSAAFARQAAELCTKRPGSAEAMSVIQAYGGRFAPEFEYEEWALRWRDHVHSAFLDLVEQAAKARMPARAPEASAILRHAIAIDPEALELKPLLAASLFLSGSEAAARHLYRQFALEHEREFGEPAAPLQTVLESVSRD